MAIVTLNKYTGTYSPGNTKQSVLATTLVDAVALLIESVEGVEPDLVQCTEKNILANVPDPVPEP